MDYFYLLSYKLLGVCGVLAFLWAVLLRKTRWIFFFVPAVLSFTTLFYIKLEWLGFGVHWFNYVFVFLVIIAVRKKKYLYLDHKIIISLFIFLTFATALSMVVSIDRTRSLGRAMTLLLVLSVGVYTIPSISNINKNSTSQSLNLYSFMWGIVFWSSITAILFASFYGARSLQGNLGSAHFIIGSHRIDRLQIPELETNATGFGYGIGVGVLYSFLGYIVNTSGRKRFFYIVMFFVSLFVLFLTQSRSASVAVFGAIVFWIILEGRKTKSRNRIIFISSIVAVLGIYFHDYIWAFFGRGGTFYVSVYDVFYQSRGSFWMTLIEKAGASLFYGFGLGNDRGYWKNISGDNSYLIMMVQVGFIGLCLYLVPLFFAVYNTYRWDRKAIMNKKQFLPIFPYMVYIIIINAFADGLAIPTVTVSHFFALGILTKTHNIFDEKSVNIKASI